jgi:RNA polymerase sigma-70 factor (ECF subfamily)
MPTGDLERLFGEHAEALYGFLAYRVGDPTIAEDLLGDTFERVVRAHHRFDPRKGSETTWLYSIALNCLRDHLRRAKAERAAIELSGRDADPWQQDLTERVRDRDELMGGLGTLDPQEREILALRFGADLRLQDIAAVTGLPPTTVRGRLYAGLRKLAAALQPDTAASG